MREPGMEKAVEMKELGKKRVMAAGQTETIILVLVKDAGAAFLGAYQTLSCVAVTYKIYITETRNTCPIVTEVVIAATELERKAL